MGKPHALAAALQKLEWHHTAQLMAAVSYHDNSLPQFLRSYPSTCERINALPCLAQAIRAAPISHKCTAWLFDPIA